MDRPHYPPPEFFACVGCGMPGACKAARHCAKLPRPVEQPQPTHKPSKKLTELLNPLPEDAASVRLGA